LPVADFPAPFIFMSDTEILQESPRHPNASLGEKVMVMLASWLLPGAGYCMKGDIKLGLANMVLLQATFLIGVFALHAGVATPILDTASAEFSVINVLIFGGQLINGIFALVSMMIMQANPTALGVDIASWQADLGMFYLLVSGLLNAFVMFGIWDRYYGLDYKKYE
jgi:hypothetical protein